MSDNAPPFRRILIANRGEIALRIIWACKELGITTVSVHSEADKDALHVRFADESFCIGPAASEESYLSVPRIISTAEVRDVDAIHPGYGYLAENDQFAEICQECKITFIGPSPETIRLMGNKAEARQVMKKAGIPIIPGSDGPVKDVAEALKISKAIGYPVLVKASAGGGGKGMRLVRTDTELNLAFSMASREAQAAFGNPEVYVEKYLTRPRHVEFQILGDEHGNIIHLGERECSIQRRHQKLIEETPSVAVDPVLRKVMGEAAVAAARSVGYKSAGTVEFLLDSRNRFYFMEMNTRIQVEHPITEMITGIDLIKEQIRVAVGEVLRYGQEDVTFRGHAIECRINAEDPETFTPSPGMITTFYSPGGPGVRIDTAAHQDCLISPFYDSLIMKLITFGNDRQEAIKRMQRALGATVIEGIKTTVPLHLKILQDPAFNKGDIHTGFLETILPFKEK